MSIWDGKGKGSGNEEFIKKGEKKNEVSTSSVIVVDCTRTLSPGRKLISMELYQAASPQLRLILHLWHDPLS